jgi:hypothetical protein
MIEFGPKNADVKNKKSNKILMYATY